MHQANKNRIAGKRFEQMFQHRAQLSGLLCVRNEPAFRWMPGGKVRPVKSELDFTLVTRMGQTAFVDTKSFDTERTNRSALSPAQVQRAYRYNLWRLAAGFVIEFVPLGQVYFFSGIQMHCLPSGQPILPSSGILLGASSSFDASKVMACDLGVSSSAAAASSTASLAIA